MWPVSPIMNHRLLRRAGAQPDIAAMIGRNIFTSAYSVPREVYKFVCSRSSILMPQRVPPLNVEYWYNQTH